MDDENRFGTETEDTSALFVSTQKKLKAEEEARKKAAEEQSPQRLMCLISIY